MNDCGLSDIVYGTHSSGLFVLQSLEPFYDQFDPDFINIRKTVREVLQKEDDLNEIVQLVGKVSATCKGCPPHVMHHSSMQSLPSTSCAPQLNAKSALNISCTTAEYQGWRQHVMHHSSMQSLPSTSHAPQLNAKAALNMSCTTA